MLLFLIGFMGSGKSTLGKRLAKKLGYEFIDMDELLEEREGLSVSEIFSKKGEKYFRSLENELIRSFDKQKKTVIATGGGAPCHDDNMKLMNEKGITVYLKMSPGGLASRLENAKHLRPLIANLKTEDLQDYISDKLKEREEYYLESKCIIKGENVKPEHVISLVYGNDHSG
jgi:shikimate kinase